MVVVVVPGNHYVAFCFILNIARNMFIAVLMGDSKDMGKVLFLTAVRVQ